MSEDWGHWGAESRRRCPGLAGVALRGPLRRGACALGGQASASSRLEKGVTWESEGSEAK